MKTFANACAGCAGALLAVASAAKAWELFNGAHYLRLPDAVMHGWRLEHTTWMAVVVELLVVALLFHPRVSWWHKGLACAWLAVSFASYHIIAGINLPGGPCRCFGRFLGWLGLSEWHSQWVVRTAIAVLGLCGLALIALAARQGGAGKASASMEVRPDRA